METLAITLSRDQSGNATKECSGQRRGSPPICGIMACESEQPVQTKISGKYPDWFTWSDRKGPREEKQPRQSSAGSEIEEARMGRSKVKREEEGEE